MEYKIREIRKKKKISQDELSKMSGVSRGVIHRLESERDYETTVGTLKAIADALGVSVKYLFLP